MKHFKLMDFVIILFLLACGIFLIIKSSSLKGSTVLVKALENEYEYSLKKDGVYKVQGALGITKFQIKKGRVRIIESACPNKTCVNQGWGSPLVCLPNHVIISVEEKGEFDAISQ